MKGRVDLSGVLFEAVEGFSFDEGGVGEDCWVGSDD